MKKFYAFAVALFIALAPLAAQATVYSAPGGPKQQFVDANGAPMSGGTLQTLLAGSSTPQITYTTSTGSVANPTTITLNTRGETPNEVWFAGGVSYKFVLRDSSGVTVWTLDGLSGVNDVTAQIGNEWIASGLTPTFVSGTSFTVTGDQTQILHVGRRLKSTNSGGTIYSTITATVFAATTTVTVANDTGNLDAGMTGLSYGIVSANNASVSPEMVYRKGAAVVSATTTNIWNIAGDFLHITGTTTITGLGTAPYAGAMRTVVFDGALTLTHNATTLKLPGAANITTAADDRMIVRADTTANMVVVAYMKASGKAVINTANTQPTRQVFTSGSGTYTTPANATRISVRLVGSGGGGAGSGTTAGAGGAGNASTFDTMSGGAGGAGLTTSGGAGGAGSNGDINITGGSGGPANATANIPGGHGGSSAFGGGGGGGSTTPGNGTTAGLNSGGGGGGAGSAGNINAGGGGGAGGYAEKIFRGPAASYSYAVGAAGTVGTAGTGGGTGGGGAAGIVIVDEFYD